MGVTMGVGIVGCEENVGVAGLFSLAWPFNALLMRKMGELDCNGGC